MMSNRGYRKVDKETRAVIMGGQIQIAIIGKNEI
jgi:hypothetical protein